MAHRRRHEELKSHIDRASKAFWAGGISNPLEVIESATWLLFLRWLDDQQLAGSANCEGSGGEQVDAARRP